MNKKTTAEVRIPCRMDEIRSFLNQKHYDAVVSRLEELRIYYDEFEEWVWEEIRQDPEESVHRLKAERRYKAKMRDICADRAEAAFLKKKQDECDEFFSRMYWGWKELESLFHTEYHEATIRLRQLENGR